MKHGSGAFTFGENVLPTEKESFVETFRLDDEIISELRNGWRMESYYDRYGVEHMRFFTIDDTELSGEKNECWEVLDYSEYDMTAEQFYNFEDK